MPRLLKTNNVDLVARKKRTRVLACAMYPLYEVRSITRPKQVNFRGLASKNSTNGGT